MTLFISNNCEIIYKIVGDTFKFLSFNVIYNDKSYNSCMLYNINKCSKDVKNKKIYSSELNHLGIKTNKGNIEIKEYIENTLVRLLEIIFYT